VSEIFSHGFSAQLGICEELYFGIQRIMVRWRANSELRIVRLKRTSGAALPITALETQLSPFCVFELVWKSTFRNYTHSEPRFRALLTGKPSDVQLALS
jgi:hypothetical protein